MQDDVEHAYGICNGDLVVVVQVVLRLLEDTTSKDVCCPASINVGLLGSHRNVKLARRHYVKYVFFIPEAEWQLPEDSQVSLITGKESVENVSEQVLTWKGRQKVYKGGRLSFLVSRVLESLDSRLKAEVNFLEFRSYFEEDTYWRKIRKQSIKKIRGLNKK